MRIQEYVEEQEYLKTERDPRDLTPEEIAAQDSMINTTTYRLYSNIYGFYKGYETIEHKRYPKWTTDIKEAKTFKSRKSASNLIANWSILRECNTEIK